METRWNFWNGKNSNGSILLLLFIHSFIGLFLYSFQLRYIEQQWTWEFIETNTNVMRTTPTSVAVTFSNGICSGWLVLCMSPCEPILMYFFLYLFKFACSAFSLVLTTRWWVRWPVSMHCVLHLIGLTAPSNELVINDHSMILY